MYSTLTLTRSAVFNLLKFDLTPNKVRLDCPLHGANMGVNAVQTLGILTGSSFLPHPSSLSSFPSLFNPARGSGERCKLPSVSGRRTATKRSLMHLEAKIKRLGDKFLVFLTVRT